MIFFGIFLAFVLGLAFGIAVTAIVVAGRDQDCMTCREMRIRVAKSIWWRDGAVYQWRSGESIIRCLGDIGIYKEHVDEEVGQ